MTIEVKTHNKQSIAILVENTRNQAVIVENALTQEVSIKQKQNREITVENALTQEVGMEQDVILVPVYKDAPPYEGEYEVTPKVSKQTLPTAKKLLSKDVTIKEIPYFEVSNTSGGNTVYIGNEV